MEDENKKTEESAEGKTSADANGQQGIPQDMLAQLWKFANNPLIANAGLGAFLMWALDPKGMKAAIEGMTQQMDLMVGKLNEQTDTIRSLKKQVNRMRHQLAGEDENGQPEENLQGYRKAKRKGSVFLD
jgi:hypothetical protein